MQPLHCAPQLVARSLALHFGVRHNGGNPPLTHIAPVDRAALEKQLPPAPARAFPAAACVTGVDNTVLKRQRVHVNVSELRLRTLGPVDVYGILEFDAGVDQPKEAGASTTHGKGL